MREAAINVLVLALWIGVPLTGVVAAVLVDGWP